MSDRTLGWYFARWLICFVEIVEGLAGVLTLGFWRPVLTLKLAFYMLKNEGRY
jgi:hypothetical protein